MVTLCMNYCNSDNMLQCYVILMPFVGGVATILKRVARNLGYCNELFFVAVLMIFNAIGLCYSHHLGFRCK
jgi:heme/copper-type cytochrome/quinol oxidase subunit 1